MAVAALALAVGGPGASVVAAGPRVASSAVVEGELVVMHADDFERGRATESYAVRSGTSTFVHTDLSAVRGAEGLVGSMVRFAGDQQGSVFVADEELSTTDSASPATAATTAAGATTRRTAVILFNFTNDTSQPWTQSLVSDTIFGAGTSSVASYYREVTYGTTELSGTVYGWLTVPYDNTGCRYGDWASEALDSSGIDPNQFQHVVYAFPRAYDCTWAGLSTVGGKFSWINGFMTLRTVGHELAHSMGVHHASALNCSSNGVRVTYSTTCTRSEYGDPFSIMGTGTRHHNNWHRGQTGWLPEMQTITTSGTYTVATAEIAGTPRLVRLARGDGSYLYFEARQPFGTYDNFATTAAVVKGVTIRVAPDKPIRTQSLLLDTTPSTATFEDASLAVGRTFTDPVSQVSITTSAVSSAGATIAVHWPGFTPAPTATPTSTPTPTPAPTASPSPTPTASPTAPPSASPTPTPSPTSTAAPKLALAAPTNVSATQTARRNVSVTWSPVAGSDLRYRVLLNGTRVATTRSLFYVDWIPRDLRWATYTVRALAPDGKVGPLSVPVTIRIRR